MFITDTEEWVGKGWLKAWVEYRKKVSPNAKAILLRIDAYNTRPFDDKEAVKNGVYQVFGWSDNVVSYIKYIVENAK